MEFAKKMIERRKQDVKQYPYDELKDKLLNDLVQRVVLEEKSLVLEEN
jgi:hypothetical protein